MPNEFMTRDEVVLEIAIPALRAALKAALKHPPMTPIPNMAAPDLMPLAFTEEALKDGGAKYLAGLEAMEKELRERLEKRCKR